MDSCWKEGFNLYESCFSKRFNSLNHFVKRVQFFESPSEECSILWLKFLKIRFNCLNHIQKEFNSVSRVQKECSILWIRKVFNWVSKMGSILCVMKKKKKVQFFWVTKRVQFFESNWKKFNPLSHIPDKVQVFESFWEKKSGSILWVVFRMFNSFSRVQKKCSILWIIWEKTILWVILIIQKSSILWVVFKKRFNY